jgi:hypothetical protein
MCCMGRDSAHKGRGLDQSITACMPDEVPSPGKAALYCSEPVQRAGSIAVPDRLPHRWTSVRGRIAVDFVLRAVDLSSPR